MILRPDRSTIAIPTCKAGRSDREMSAGEIVTPSRRQVGRSRKRRDQGALRPPRRPSPAAAKGDGQTLARRFSLPAHAHATPRTLPDWRASSKSPTIASALRSAVAPSVRPVRPDSFTLTIQESNLFRGFVRCRFRAPSRPPPLPMKPITLSLAQPLVQ